LISKFIHRIRKNKIILIISCVIVLALVAIAFFQPNSSINPFIEHSQGSDDDPEKTSAGTLVRGTPDYDILLPSGKGIEQLGGGWIRNDSQPLFVYVDKIGTTKINVSEQPLPQDLQTDTELEVEKLAQNYNITEKITVGSTIIHIGTFDKGLQRVIFSKSNLLLLITSNDNLSTDVWIQYISSLS
jgi:hypothetical protein